MAFEKLMKIGVFHINGAFPAKAVVFYLFIFKCLCGTFNFVVKKAKIENNDFYVYGVLLLLEDAISALEYPSLPP